MNYLRFLTFITLSFVFPHCNSGSDKSINTERTFIANALQKSNLSVSQRWIVILPGLGCKGCIQEAEGFVKDYVDSSNIYFVLTKIQSLKLLQQKVESVLTGRANVYIDRQGIFDIPTKNGIYPCIVKMNNGKIVDHRFQSPADSQAFEWLKIQME